MRHPHAQKWWAIPLRPNGQEKMGTEGCLCGYYTSKRTFVRYLLNPYGQPGTLYNLYIRTSNGEWILKGSRYAR